MDIRRYPSLRIRIAIVLIIMAAISTAALTYLLYINFRVEQRNNLRHRLEVITTLAGLQQDGDLLLQVGASHDGPFDQINAQNVLIKNSDPDLIYVYVMRKDERGIYFVVDAGLPGEEGIAAFEEVYDDAGPTLVENFDTLDRTLLEPDYYTDKFGTFLSAYTPIYSSNGERVGVLGVDISASTILSREREYLIRLLTIYFLSLPFIIVAGIILADYLAKPIVQIRDAANRISKGDFSINIAEIPHTRELAELAIDFNKMTENLRGLIVDLERRVEERTEAITRRTTQLRAASYIARQAAEVQDVSRLLERFVELVSDQFGYYHTGVYLINDAGDKITLRAASSEGGSRMMTDEKALRPGMQGIVNFVAQTKKPKILADIGTDATIFNNPDLPLTRSEIALPLLVRGRLLGVLDIQSDKPSAFTTQDLDVFETLADQLAVAIDNARLLEESQAALLQLEAVTTARTRDAWDQKLKEKPRVVTYTPLGLRAEKSGDVITGNGVGVPVLLRGQKIGTVTVTKKDLAPWNQPDQDLIEEVATQAGLAIENIRLLDEATTRAKQEQLVGGLAFRFSQALDIDSLLQTAARELGQIPGVEEATVVLTQSSEPVAAASSPSRQPLRRTSS
jgi:GAF domain-containing protein